MNKGEVLFSRSVIAQMKGRSMMKGITGRGRADQERITPTVTAAALAPCSSAFT